eukprot:g45180.t1
MLELIIKDIRVGCIENLKEQYMDNGTDKRTGLGFTKGCIKCYCRSLSVPPVATVPGVLAKFSFSTTIGAVASVPIASELEMVTLRTPHTSSNAAVRLTGRLEHDEEKYFLSDSWNVGIIGWASIYWPSSIAFGKW